MREHLVRCRLKLGEVVAATEPHLRSSKASRGVVAWADGAGETAGWAPMYANDYVIDISPGHLAVTTNHGPDWLPVPSEDWTVRERVRSAELRWHRPTWISEDWRDWPEWECYEYAVLRAMLPFDVQDEVFGEHCDTPGLAELALIVAEWFDDRLANRQTLGSALARLGG